MIKPRICAVIAGSNMEAISKAEGLADLFEVRIDLIGSKWQQVAAGLRKPWIAANRNVANHGRHEGSEEQRVNELLAALQMGADIIDIEIETPGLEDIVTQVKGKAKCLLSYHDWSGTKSPETLAAMVHRQLTAGADICKVVTTATGIDDNLAIIRLPSLFPWASVIALAMGTAGALSRV
ncbi:MAG: type I 3-dehydroquinate dehydratase, partial [Chloroflexi bacterium]|nr:type I 3-dehydroquinate dehydratase [Chloroflexota bacterium]